jgi:hypothetical protein
MKAGRLTIAGMLGLIAFVAVAAAAMKNPTTLWTQILVTASLTSLMLASLAAIVHRGDRSFAIGFAVIGWTYLVLSLAPWFEEHVGPWLLTTRVADEVYVRFLQQEKNSHMQELMENNDIYPWGMNTMNWMDDSRFPRYRRIIHSLSAIAHGLAGGLAAIVLARKPRSARPEVSS